VNKAIGFFLALTEDVGIAVSPLFKTGAATTGNGGPRRSPRRKKVSQPKQQPPAPATITPPMPTSKEAQQVAYINMLMDMAQKTDGTGGINTDLLDRIEKMLGVSTQATTTEGVDQGG
jgi:hypothetical protein